MDIGNVYQYMNEILLSYNKQARTTFGNIKDFATSSSNLLDCRCLNRFILWKVGYSLKSYNATNKIASVCDPMAHMKNEINQYKCKEHVKQT